MRQDGLTLIELLIVITIIGILIVVSGFEFSGWMARYKVESEIKDLYTDLSNARTLAMQRNINYFLRLNSAATKEYSAYEDTNNDDACCAGDTKIGRLSKQNRSHDIAWNGGGVVDIGMDRRGIFEPSTAPLGINIWLLKDDGTTYGNSEVDYDCIVIAPTRISMGKYDGATCQAK
ncbi:MAG: prepilin-type N-terminal cleavage/methylation domain-containing protein [Nitrospirota bacterium]